ncbi:g3828 [Coccomyxa viridis]|uniref:G3828 protein n=1 Tax=Coccomyxa viridis TaxID=1274662 RepID=A0ABP1FTV0_9CHLO
MASKDGSRARGRGRRQTRSGLASASDEDEYIEQPTVKRVSRRTSIISVEPKGHPENGVENFSVHEVQDQQGAGEEHGARSAPPAASERLRATAGKVGGQIQDTLSSAMNTAGLSWRTLGTVLLLATLTSLLTSRLAQPNPAKQNASSMDHMEKRYSSLMKKLQDAEQRLETTEGKVQNFDRSFQQGSSDEGTVLSKKTDPNIILNLAEQRVQSLFDKFSADKTGLVDFALAPAGGKVISHTQLVPRPDDPGLTTLSQLGAALVPGGKPSVHPMADKFILTPGGPVPGECLPLNGTKGEISIRLREPIIPTAITYEHVPSAITFDFRSAPNDITVVGWLSAAYRLAKKPGHWLPAVEHRQAVPPTKIGSFSYDFSRGNLQTVALDSDIVVDHVRFQGNSNRHLRLMQVESNYGRPDYTCIYRIRVHGMSAAGRAGDSAEDVASSAGSATSGSF